MKRAKPTWVLHAAPIHPPQKQTYLPAGQAAAPALPLVWMCWKRCLCQCRRLRCAHYSQYNWLTILGILVTSGDSLQPLCSRCEFQLHFRSQSQWWRFGEIGALVQNRGCRAAASSDLGQRCCEPSLTKSSWDINSSTELPPKLVVITWLTG